MVEKKEGVILSEISLEEKKKSFTIFYAFELNCIWENFNEIMNKRRWRQNE